MQDRCCHLEAGAAGGRQCGRPAEFAAAEQGTNRAGVETFACADHLGHVLGYTGQPAVVDVEPWYSVRVLMRGPSPE